VHDIGVDRTIEQSTDRYFNFGSSYNKFRNIHHCQNRYLKRLAIQDFRDYCVVIRATNCITATANPAEYIIYHFK
jgi:hypothetical protein